MTAIKLLHLTSIAILILIGIYFYFWLLFRIIRDLIRYKEIDYLVMAVVLVLLGITAVTGFYLQLNN